MQKVGAAISQLFSWLTTLSFVYLFTQPDQDLRRWGLTVLVSVALEALLFAFKEGLFRKHPLLVAVGLFGVVADGIINTGGFFQIAAPILTFPPVMIMLGVAEVDMANPDELLAVSLAVSALLGLVLSIAPHILWRDWSKKGAVKTA